MLPRTRRRSESLPARGSETSEVSKSRNMRARARGNGDMAHRTGISSGNNDRVRVRIRVHYPQISDAKQDV